VGLPLLLLLLLQSVVALRGKDQSSMMNHQSTVSATYGWLLSASMPAMSASAL
jgi:hypothetical protein